MTMSLSFFENTAKCFQQQSQEHTLQTKKRMRIAMLIRFKIRHMKDLRPTFSPAIKKGLIASLTIIALLGIVSSAHASPINFSQAKRLLREHVYFDKNNSQGGTFYCGCKWQWVGKSGGRIYPESCGINAPYNERALRTEYEHITPISLAAKHRQCWIKGGRANCKSADPVFNRMEADMHNLTIVNGRVNELRSNKKFGMVAGNGQNYGSCPTKIGGVIEPRDESKGMAARVTFYMADRYNIRLSRQDQQVLMAWDRQYPVSAWEVERDRRIKRSMGHSNPFVTGEAVWEIGFKPRSQGLNTKQLQQAAQKKNETEMSEANISGPIIGNRRSGVYHMPSGCPSYGAVGLKNRIQFASEEEAISAGYRKAGNCT